MLRGEDLAAPLLIESHIGTPWRLVERLTLTFSHFLMLRPNLFMKRLLNVDSLLPKRSPNDFLRPQID